MFPARRLLPLLFLVAPLVASEPARPSATPGRSSLVSVGADGRLRYAAYTAQGDTLPDFSACGYGGGGVALPEAPVGETLAPAAEGDDAPRLQAALDRLAALPPDGAGLRGALLLQRGRYRVGQTLQVRASGVVVRGEGETENDTVLLATARKQQPLFALGAAAGPREEAKSAREIAEAVVPVGAKTFSVRGPHDFAVGQTVFVVRHGNAAWISELGMDRIRGRPANEASTKQWQPFDLKFDRVITAVDGDRITVDAPIACAIEQRWGGGALVRYADPRIERCGVENLRAVSVFDETKTATYQGEKVFVDEAHATHVVQFGAVKNAWARHVTAVAFYHGPAQVTGRAKWTTVEDCTSLSPVSEITGGRRYPYDVEGQLTLVQRCTSDRARHAFVFGARVPGPNVFLECTSTHDYATSEPHHRWSVGGLYDNVEAHMAIQDRQWMGSGHGWAGANYVVWNSRGELVCQQPPTAQNFSIGFVGKRGKDAFARPAGWWESEGTPVEPRSLYLAQLAARSPR
jgi:hypothetical protein